MTSLEPKINQIIKELPESQVKLNENLSNHTYMKVGGPADVLFIAKSIDDLQKAIVAAIKFDLPYIVLGGASNVLVKDGGIRGLVIKNRSDGIRLIGFKGINQKEGISVSHGIIEAESGVIVNQMVRFSIENELEGLEEFLGIPGTVGGATYNNSHHLTHLIGDYIESVTVIDEKGEVKVLSKQEMKFDYDYSRLHNTKEIILKVTFSLKKGDPKILWSRAHQALQRRRDTQPLEMPSSGCMFKNIGKANALIYNTPNHQTAAGFLIDISGMKGIKLGGAQVSQKHANFIVNLGSAKASDIIKLSDKIISEIQKRFGLVLEREVFIIGED